MENIPLTSGNLAISLLEGSGVRSGANPIFNTMAEDDGAATNARGPRGVWGLGRVLGGWSSGFLGLQTLMHCK